MYRIYADDQLVYSPELINEGYDVINPKLTMELNKAGSLEFTMTTENLMYDKLQKLKTTVKVYSGTTKSRDNLIWRGRVLHDEKDFYNRKQVYCEGELAFLNDSVVRPYSYNSSVIYAFREYLAQHNSQVTADRQFAMGEVTVTDNNDYIVRSSIQYPNTLNEMTDKLLNILGGYFKVGFRYANEDDRVLNYVTEYGKTSNQIIKFGENLLDITEYIDATDVFTVLIPLGKKAETSDGTEGTRLTIESVNNGKDYIENTTATALFGKIVRTQVWEDMTEAKNLLNKGKVALDNNIEMAVTLSIKAVDLHLLDINSDEIELGDYIRVISEPHGLDKFFLCSKIVLNMESPDKTEYTLGVALKGMTDQQIAQRKQSQTAYNIAESASNTVSNISIQISGDYVSKSDFSAFEAQVNDNFAAVNNKLAAVYHYKGSVDNFKMLPSSNRTVGDVWNVLDTGANYAWTGVEWDKLSETIDLSGYVETVRFTELVNRVKALEEGLVSSSGITLQEDIVSINSQADVSVIFEGNTVIIE